MFLHFNRIEYDSETLISYILYIYKFYYLYIIFFSPRYALILTRIEESYWEEKENLFPV